MNRRDLLRGLICAPLVISTPGLLMPVKALPVERLIASMVIKGIWLDGSWFDIGIEQGHSVMDVAGMFWFDNVARIDSVEYTNVDMQHKMIDQQRHFEQGRRFDPRRGQAMKLPIEHVNPFRAGKGSLADRYYGLHDLHKKV